MHTVNNTYFDCLKTIKDKIKRAYSCNLSINGLYHFHVEQSFECDGVHAARRWGWGMTEAGLSGRGHELLERAVALAEVRLATNLIRWTVGGSRGGCG